MKDDWSPPLKPVPEDWKRSPWMDPMLGFKIKLVMSIIFVIFCLVVFGFNGAVIGLILAVFLTKATPKMHRW